MYGKLTKVSDNENALRTKEVLGHFVSGPCVNRSFMMVGKALSGWGWRYVETSVVQKIEKLADGKLRLTTLNSTYELEDLSDPVVVEDEGSSKDRALKKVDDESHLP